MNAHFGTCGEYIAGKKKNEKKEKRAHSVPEQAGPVIMTD